MNKEFRGKRKKKQSLNIIVLGLHGKCTCSNSINLLHFIRKGYRGAAHFAFRGPQRPKFSKENIYVEKWSGLQPSLKALSILADSAAPFTTILAQGKNPSNVPPSVVLSMFADLHLQLGDFLKL